MASCFKCKRPVYFAERTTALGKEWHRPCFSCTECGKVLQPGKHTEHKGLPYCEFPCYLSLFGPRGYRQGMSSAVDKLSPTLEMEFDYGDFYAKKTTQEIDYNLDCKVKAYNEYYADNKQLQVTKKQFDDKIIIEGRLRIFWGIERPLRFRQKDESATPSKIRHSGYCFAISNVVENGENLELQNGGNNHSSFEFITDVPDIASNICDDSGPGDHQQSAVVMRRRVRRRRTSKRLSVINGHLYDAETSIFVPSYGSVTNVTVSNLDTCPSVIKALLDKFKVENYPEEYCLCLVKYNGETRAFANNDVPLVEWIMHGPNEDNYKIFILERQQAFDITEQVAQYVSLPEAVLQGFLEKLSQDEEREIGWIQERFKYRREALGRRLFDIAPCSEV